MEIRFLFLDFGALVNVSTVCYVIEIAAESPKERNVKYSYIPEGILAFNSFWYPRVTTT